MIREYKSSDLNATMEVWTAATALAHDFITQEFSEKVATDMREIYMPHPQANTWVFETDDKVIGFISMLGNEIGGLFVHPDYHSRGMGRQLVEHVRPMHESLEVEVFEKNRIGRAFYNKYGFQGTDTFLHEESGEMVIRMSINLLK